MGKDIEPGDSLITSDVPGTAQVDDPVRFGVGHVFGRAAQRVVWSEVTPGPDGKRRAVMSVLLDSSLRDGRASAALRKPRSATPSPGGDARRPNANPEVNSG